MPPSKCLNCNANIPEKAYYCHQCGQSIKEVEMTFSNILKEGLSIFYNFDSRFWRTLKKVLVPHLLADTYTKGQRRVYVNPIRLLVVSLFVFTILIVISKPDFHLDLNNGLEDDLLKQNLYHEGDTLINVLAYDYLSPDVRDSIMKLRYGDVSEFDSVLTFSIFGVDAAKYGITKSDAVNLEEEEIFSKYNIDAIFEMLIVRVGLRISKNPSDTIYFVLSNTIWIILLQCMIGACTLFLYFWRKNYYFVEHLVINLYGHSTMIIVLIFAYILSIIFENQTAIIFTLASLVIIITLYIGLKKYYRLSVFRSILLLIYYVLSYALGLGVSVLLIWLFGVIF